jgi:menaquinone-9 beta-reductase
VQEFDVAVVGARCAGSPLATMLSRRGLRVCLLDKAEFPSETLSTHLIQPSGVAILDRLGMLEPILAAGAAKVDRLTFVAEDARIEATIDPAAFPLPAVCIRRVALDHLLVEAAASAGAEVRTGTRVIGLLWERGRVVGVETAEGALPAKLVVGADGCRSTVAELAGAREYYVAPPGRLFAWAYFEGAAEVEGRLRLGSLGDLAYVASPTDAGLYLAAVCPPMEVRDAFLADREGGYAAGLAAWPELADLLAGASRVGPIRVMASWHGYFREAAGPGWALLGDAGHFKDPSPAQGIADAFRQGERLAEAIAAGLDGGAGIDDELRRWWRWRDEDGDEMHWFAADVGTPGSPPLATQVIRDMATDQEAIEGLLRVLDHDLLPSGLFTPRRLGRAAAHVVRERPGEIPAMAKEIATEIRKGVARARQRRARRRLPHV